MTKKLRTPRIDKHGELDIESVNSLGFRELSGWIERVLLRRQPAAGAHLSELPHTFLRRIYHRLNPDVRECFRDALLEHLEHLVRDAASPWRSDGGDELLLLVGDLFSHREGSRSPLPQIRYAIQQGIFLTEKDEGLHWRCLQTLIALGDAATPSFWQRHHRQGDRRYASITLAGLGFHGLEKMFDWLRRQATEDPVVLDALTSRLPLLVKQEGAQALTRPLAELSVHLDEIQQNELVKQARSLGLAALDPPRPVADFWKEMKDEEIEDLARGLGIELDVRGSDRSVLATKIERRARQAEELRRFQDRLPARLHVISGVLGLMASFQNNQQIDFRPRTRERVCSVFDQLREGFDLDTDVEWELEYSALTVKNPHEDLRAGFEKILSERKHP